LFEESVLNNYRGPLQETPTRQILLRKKFGIKELPFKMLLFPLPVIISIAIWIFLFISTGWFALWGSLIAVIGVIVYMVKQRLWPEG
jgi:hypothetical protein